MKQSLGREALLIRRIGLGDVERITAMVNDPEVVRWTLNIPHPYRKKDAVGFVRRCQRCWRAGTEFVFALEVADAGLVGVMGLSKVSHRHACAELGYWLGREYWRRGYATWGVRLVLEYGFRDLGLFRIYASTFNANPASRRVLEKSGFQLEGVMRQAVVRFDTRQDLLNFGILRPEFEARLG